MCSVKIVYQTFYSSNADICVTMVINKPANIPSGQIEESMTADMFVVCYHGDA